MSSMNYNDTFFVVFSETFATLMSLVSFSGVNHVATQVAANHMLVGTERA